MENTIDINDDEDDEDKVNYREDNELNVWFHREIVNGYFLYVCHLCVKWF